MIMKIFLSYLPSRLLVVLNSLVIVPTLVHMMSEKEIGIFQLSIGMLNLVCTCSTDWIAKSALRFYEKYRSCNRLDVFFSNMIWLTLFVYLIIFVCFLLFADIITEKLFIPKAVLLLTLFLVIPAGIRQFVYQILRVLNRPFLYSFSIVIYQMSLLALFLLFTGFMTNVFAVLAAMAIAMVIIDIYMLTQIGLKINSLQKIHFRMLFESLKYALPQIVTNSSIWIILHINKYIFQFHQYFSDTAVAGAACFLVTSVLSPILSTFSFAIFPFIIKKYETKNLVKPYLTNAVQLYCCIFIPAIALFCYFPKIITSLSFADKYSSAYLIIPFLAVSLFMHEFVKLLNIKYHLHNKTYIEMAVGLFTGLVCLNLNFFLIPKFHLLGAGFSMLASMILLFTLNNIISIKNIKYISYLAIIKTCALTILITGISYLFVTLLFIPMNFIYIDILKMLLYTFLCYFMCVASAKKLLG